MFLSQLDELFNYFVSGSNNKAGVTENGTGGIQIDALVDNFGSTTLGENSTSHNQVLQKFITNSIRKESDSVVTSVKSQFHETILTAMDRVIMPNVETAVKSITGSTGRGLSSVVQKADQRDFSRNLENTPFLIASSRTDLSIKLIRKMRLEVEKLLKLVTSRP